MNRHILVLASLAIAMASVVRAGSIRIIRPTADQGPPYIEATPADADRAAAPVRFLAIDPRSPQTLYVALTLKAPRNTFNQYLVYASPLSADVIFRSEDGGESWKPVPTPLVNTAGARSTFVAAIAVDPNLPGIVYAATGGDLPIFDHVFMSVGVVFRSDDEGQTWTPILDNADVPNSILIDRANSSILYVGAFSAASPVAVLKSPDSGVDWFNVSPPAPPEIDGCTAPGIDPSNPSVVYAGGCVMVPLYRSSDGGESWSPASTGLPAEDIPLSAFAIASSRPTTLYAGTLAHGVFRSLDSGAHWASVDGGMGTPLIYSLAVDPRNAAVVYAGTDSGLFKTTNAGAQWVPTGPLAGLRVNTVILDPSFPNTLYAATSQGVFKSTDAGATWSAKNAGLPPAGLVAVPAPEPATVGGR